MFYIKNNIFTETNVNSYTEVNGGSGFVILNNVIPRDLVIEIDGRPYTSIQPYSVFQVDIKESVRIKFSKTLDAGDEDIIQNVALNVAIIEEGECYSPSDVGYSLNDTLTFAFTAPGSPKITNIYSPAAQISGISDGAAFKQCYFYLYNGYNNTVEARYLTTEDDTTEFVENSTFKWNNFFGCQVLTTQSSLTIDISIDFFNAAIDRSPTKGEVFWDTVTVSTTSSKVMEIVDISRFKHCILYIKPTGMVANDIFQLRIEIPYDDGLSYVRIVSMYVGADNLAIMPISDYIKEHNYFRILISSITVSTSYVIEVKAFMR